MNTLNLQLITPSGIIINKPASKVSCPTTLGKITILPLHAKLIAELKPGELVVYESATNFEHIHVDGGFVEVKENGQVTILADAAAHVMDLDEAHILEAKKHAEELLKHTVMADEEYAFASSNLEKSLSKLKSIKRHHHRTNKPITSEGVFKN